ncbi:MAG: hypothetical protein IJJ69_13915 [Oscillospiraceae bacterium]|nr:hypothetical protein [Oscillospiraceae bacterium]
MAVQKKIRRRPRYDRLLIAGILLIACILLISGCVKKRKTKQNTEESGNVVENITITNETANAENYPKISIETSKVHSGNLILVNKAFPCQIDAEAVKNGTSSEIQFVTIKSILDTKNGTKPYTASDWEVGLDRAAAHAMDRWFETFSQETGIHDLRMIGGYKPESADPDFQTGRTLTIGVFPETGSSYAYRPENEYAWLSEHAAEYGFILRYPEGKDDYFDDEITERRTATFRYVGIAAASYITTRNICLEEFLQEIRQYSVSNMLVVKNGSDSFGMYYVPADLHNETTSFAIPSNQSSYDISGNNADGFIVTIYE